MKKKDNLLILDLKTKIDNSKSKELNLGLVYRYIYNDKAIFGIYNYFDYRKTGNNFNVKGWTGGVEVLSEYLDGRVNFYLPQNKTKKNTKRNYTYFFIICSMYRRIGIGKIYD